MSHGFALWTSRLPRTWWPWRLHEWSSRKQCPCVRDQVSPNQVPYAGGAESVLGTTILRSTFNNTKKKEKKNYTPLALTGFNMMRWWGYPACVPSLAKSGSLCTTSTDWFYLKSNLYTALISPFDVRKFAIIETNVFGVHCTVRTAWTTDGEPSQLLHLLCIPVTLIKMHTHWSVYIQCNQTFTILFTFTLTLSFRQISIYQLHFPSVLSKVLSSPSLPSPNKQMIVCSFTSR